MLRKRYVKRVIHKIIYFLMAILVLSYITSVLVERRLKAKQQQTTEIGIEKVTEILTDMNGDPVTPPYKAPFNIEPSRRPARPPRQLRHYLEDLKAEHAQKLDIEALIESKEFELPIPLGEKRDWHDYEAIAADMKRVGLGEHGQPAYLNDDSMREVEARMSLQNGFNALLSDAISVNRSLPDVRKDGCKSKRYLAHLPKVSVVIPFFNEHFSVLLRTLHSIVNRSPSELLKEIIIVDDGSEREYLKDQLDDYIAENFAQIVQIVRLTNRTGLIGARLAGAHKATGDVLIFFDSHIECNVNWLPPLLEPIAMHEKIATCPIVDIIDHANFGYNGGYQEGFRGAFDWTFAYKQLPLLPTDHKIDKTRPFRNPVMMGGLFAISRNFFWELGGYDAQLEIWGGEQYELSFKIWMCGGLILDVPCSRVAHIFRGPWDNHPNPKKYNFVARNHKRVAEVWMDEYKEYAYLRDPELYASLDVGDLSAQKAIRTRLQCKTFKWFMEVVAPDIALNFPPIPPPSYAHGALQNLAYPTYCLDSMGKGTNHAVGLFACAVNKTHPQDTQNWQLSWHRDMRLKKHNQCLDVQDNHLNATVWMWSCHEQGGNQFWFYDRQQQWLVHGKGGKNCLEAVIENDKHAVYTNPCDVNNPAMKWIFAVVNDTALDIFYN